MIEDNTPTVTARRRKPTQNLRIRLETARRLQNLNAKTKARRRQKSKSNLPEQQQQPQDQQAHAYTTAPRIPKIKKNQLSRPPPPDAKYRKRQRCKTWLPTHVFHAKRAHMTPAAQPLWRFALPLSPTEKSYRPSHRARGSRGAVAWDMSYMATILIEGAENGLEGVLKGVGVDGEEAWGRKGRKWREGTRVLQTWVFEQGPEGEGEDGRKRGRPIAPVTLIRAGEKKQKEPNEVEMVDADDSSRSKTKKNKGDRRKIFIRVHPSAFFQLWNDLLGLAKRQSPPVMVEDLRFDIGSIEVAGPGSTEALIAALQPYSSFTRDETPAAASSDSDSPETTWTSLLGVTNPSSLPQNALLAFPISDPRLRFPCQTLRPRLDESHMQDQARLLASWPPDRTQGPAQLFDRPFRLAASRQLPSQKAINRRRTLAGPGRNPDPQPNDPQIPIILFASRPSATVGNTANYHGKSNPNSNLPGSWTVLLPWKCVLPVWYTLMYYPLSSGGNPRFGGVQEQQQLAFEAGTPWFPGDFPGTRAGWEWGLRERERTRQEWERRPKGRRVEFDRLDLGHGKQNGDGRAKRRGEFGRGWACDWERLLQLEQVQPELFRDEEGNNEGCDARPLPGQQKQSAEFNSGPRPAGNSLPQQIYQLRPEEAEARLAGYHQGSHSQKSIISIDRGALATVRISLVGGGTPAPRARIYRLPDDEGLRQQWLRQAQATDRNNNSSDNSEQTIIASEAVRWSGVESAPPGEDRLAVPPLPDDDDVVGFVTTGGYNLAAGQGTGIASIALSKMTLAKSKSAGKRAGLCIVRGAGERVGRLGRWTLA